MVAGPLLLLVATDIVGVALEPVTARLDDVRTTLGDVVTEGEVTTTGEAVDLLKK